MKIDEFNEAFRGGLELGANGSTKRAEIIRSDEPDRPSRDCLLRQ